jgi:hypothetical protein
MAIDVDFSRKAPAGKFRLVGVDTFDGDDWLQGDYDTLEEAMQVATEKTAGEQMLFYHVYDDHGKHVGQRGRW